MAQHTSSGLFDSSRKSLQRELLDIVYHLTHNNSTSQDEILCLVSEASRTLRELKRIGQMMLLDASAHEITRVAPISYFRQLVERDGQTPMTEFEWACLYTQDSLNMLTEHIMANRTPIENARNFEAQAILWDMRVQFPNTLSGAGDRATPSYDALQIPSPAVVSTHSRIPQLERLESEGGRITGLYRNPRIQPR